MHIVGNRLSQILKKRREELGLSFGQLADATGITRGQLFKLEQGQVQKVQPRQLAALAEPLEVPLADLYDAAGFELPTELPSFTPYLRTKYRDLPPAARAELQQSFAQIARRYGYQPGGPRSGEDEN